MKRKICFLSVLVTLSMISACGNTLTDNTTGNETYSTKQPIEETVLPNTPHVEATIPLETEIIIQEDGTLSIEDFWNVEENEPSNTLTFATGLKIVLPQEWVGKILIDTHIASVNPRNNTLIVREKENAEAGAGGDLFYLDLLLLTDTTQINVYPSDTILGIYTQGNAKYAFILQIPREMNYVEGDNEMKKLYEDFSSDVNSVQIITENMAGFEKVSEEDLDWFLYW